MLQQSRCKYLVVKGRRQQQRGSILILPPPTHTCMCVCMYVYIRILGAADCNVARKNTVNSTATGPVCLAVPQSRVLMLSSLSLSVLLILSVLVLFLLLVSLCIAYTHKLYRVLCTPLARVITRMKDRVLEVIGAFVYIYVGRGRKFRALLCLIVGCCFLRAFTAS